MEDKNKIIAARVKELRRNKSVSQAELASKLNITVTAYNRIENDKTQITVHMLFSIAEALNVSVNRLLDLPIDNMGNHTTGTIMINAGNGRVYLSISTEELRKYLSAKR